MDAAERIDGLALAALALDGGRPGAPLALSDELRSALDARLSRLAAGPSRELAIAELAAAARPPALPCMPDHAGAAALLAAHLHVPPAPRRGLPFVPRRGYRPPDGLAAQLRRWADCEDPEARAAREVRRAQERPWPA